MIDWAKLRHEWQTAALAVVGILLEVYDACVVTGMINLPALFPEPARPWVSPSILVLMLLLRKWKNRMEIKLYVRLNNETYH